MTRERMIQAAYELFTVEGYDAVSVAKIAERAGVAERTVFRYFPEKHLLTYPEADDHLAALREEVRSGAASRGVTQRMLGDCVIALFRRVAEAGQAHRMGLRGRMINDSEELRARIYGMLSSWRQELADELAPYLDGDEHAARFAANVIITLIVETVRRWLRAGSARPLDAVAGEIVEMHRDTYRQLLAS